MINYSSLINIGASILVIIIVVFLAIWIINSILLYIAAKIVNSNVTFGKVLGATFLAPIIALIILRIFSFIGFSLIGYIVSFIAILALYKNQFEVGWGGAFAIVVLYAIIVIAILFSIIYIVKFPVISYIENITHVNLSSIQNITSLISQKLSGINFKI
ncbi:hypothetical protein YN1_4080 [Nanoarchaeota archaeon]